MERLFDGGYSQELLSYVVAWARLRNLISNHVADAQANPNTRNRRNRARKG